MNESTRASDLSATLHSFMCSRLGDVGLLDDDDIFASGLVNSLFALELITFVEDRFSLEIGIDDLELDSFRSIHALVDLVTRKQQADLLAGGHDGTSSDQAASA